MGPGVPRHNYILPGLPLHAQRAAWKTMRADDLIQTGLCRPAKQASSSPDPATDEGRVGRRERLGTSSSSKQPHVCGSTSSGYRPPTGETVPKRRGVWAVEKLIAPIYVRQGRRYNSYAYRNCLDGYIGSC